jgi:3-hydroxyacyl-CoA dehydrogenase
MERSVVVIGAGVMGHGIAQLFAQAGAAVTLQDLDTGRLAAGLAAVEGSLALLVEEELLAPAEAAAARSRIRPTTRLEPALAGAGVVVEAIPELLEAKLELFERIERTAGPGALLLSNTSTFPLARLATRALHPERMAITHFFNPAQLVPLVEVVAHPAMPAPAVEALLELLRRLGKRPVLLRRELPGFLANRLQAAVAREAFHLLEQGVASAEEIDAVMTDGPGFRWPFLGPIEIAELGGLDTWQRVLDQLTPELCRDQRAPEAIRALVARGDLGAKTGRGLLDHAARPLAERLLARDRFLIRLAKLKGGLGQPGGGGAPA